MNINYNFERNRAGCIYCDAESVKKLAEWKIRWDLKGYSVHFESLRRGQRGLARECEISNWFFDEFELARSLSGQTMSSVDTSHIHKTVRDGRSCKFKTNNPLVRFIQAFFSFPFVHVNVLCFIMKSYELLARNRRTLAMFAVLMLAEDTSHRSTSIYFGPLIDRLQSNKLFSCSQRFGGEGSRMLWSQMRTRARSKDMWDVSKIS